MPDVAYAPAIGNLLGRYVTVVGTPERDSAGRLTQIHDVAIEPAPAVAGADGVRDAVPLEDILESAPGAELGPMPGLTEDEAALYLKAIGL